MTSSPGSRMMSALSGKVGGSEDRVRASMDTPRPDLLAESASPTILR